MKIDATIDPHAPVRLPDDLDGTVVIPCDGLGDDELHVAGAFVGASSNPSSLLARLLAAQGCYDPESVLHDLRLNAGLMATLGVVLPDEAPPCLPDHDPGTWEDWRYEVVCGDTRLGIDAWVAHRAEAGS